jgi:hypothetical protein
MNEKLVEVCKNFIKNHNISCVEAISSKDSVIVDAYLLIRDICEIVGYYDYPEESDD